MNSNGSNPNEVGLQNEANRVAWVEAALKKVPAGSRILDAGAGEQRFRRACAHLTYVSQDVAQYDGKGDSHGLQTGGWDFSKFGKLDIVCDIAAIPEPDASFDAILCTEVFEHLPDPVAALKEFSRLLRPGGQLILTAPFCSLTHFAPYHYATGFGRYWYEWHLPRHGLDVTEVTPNGNYFEFLAQELRRLPSVAHRYASPRPNRLRRGWTRLLVGPLLSVLGRLSARDSGSSEALCFGLHIVAVRR